MAGFFETLFGGGAEKEAAEKNRQALAAYQGNALGALGKAYGEGTGYLKEGVAAYDPLIALGNKYGAAGDLWMGALGAGGQAGTEAARAAFSTTPGYAIAQKEALDAIDRRRAIGGMYASGNADIDTANSVTRMLYDTQYAPWMAGLQSAAGMGGQYLATGAAGRAGGYGSLANLASQYGQNQSNVYGNVTQGNIGANNMQAAGEAAGAKNLLGAGLGLVSTLASGGAFSGLGGMLGGAVGSMLAPKGGYTGWTGGY